MACKHHVLFPMDAHVVCASQVFGLLDMHEQLDAQLSVLSEVLANTSSGNVFKVKTTLPCCPSAKVA